MFPEAPNLHLWRILERFRPKSVNLPSRLSPTIPALPSDAHLGRHRRPITGGSVLRSTEERKPAKVVLTRMPINGPPSTPELERRMEEVAKHEQACGVLACVGQGGRSGLCMAREVGRDYRRTESSTQIDFRVLWTVVKIVPIANLEPRSFPGVIFKPSKGNSFLGFRPNLIWSCPRFFKPTGNPGNGMISYN